MFYKVAKLLPTHARHTDTTSHYYLTHAGIPGNTSQISKRASSLFKRAVTVTGARDRNRDKDTQNTFMMYHSDMSMSNLHTTARIVALSSISTSQNVLMSHMRCGTYVSALMCFLRMAQWNAGFSDEGCLPRIGLAFRAMSSVRARLSP